MEPDEGWVVPRETCDLLAAITDGSYIEVEVDPDDPALKDRHNIRYRYDEACVHRLRNGDGEPLCPFNLCHNCASSSRKCALRSGKDSCYFEGKPRKVLEEYAETVRLRELLVDFVGNSDVSATCPKDGGPCFSTLHTLVTICMGILEREHMTDRDRCIKLIEAAMHHPKLSVELVVDEYLHELEIVKVCKQILTEHGAIDRKTCIELIEGAMHNPGQALVEMVVDGEMQHDPSTETTTPIQDEAKKPKTTPSPLEGRSFLSLLQNNG